MNIWSEFSKSLSEDEWSALYGAIKDRIDEDTYATENTADPEQREVHAYELEILTSIQKKLGMDC